MWDPQTDDIRTQFVIAAHHRDRLRRPPAHPGRIRDDLFVQALQWNVFRTLELLPPAFWLRRLHARLAGGVPPRAPSIVGVELWSPLPLPPACVAVTGRAETRIDVLIETEHSLWALLSAAGHRGADVDVQAQFPEAIHAAAWRAGPRACHVAFLELAPSAASLGATITSRYRRSSHSFSLRAVAPSGDGMPDPTLGVIAWRDLAATLRDCAAADVLSPVERAIAGNAVRWLAAVGL